LNDPYSFGWSISTPGPDCRVNWTVPKDKPWNGPEGDFLWTIPSRVAPSSVATERPLGPFHGLFWTVSKPALCAKGGREAWNGSLDRRIGRCPLDGPGRQTQKTVDWGAVGTVPKGRSRRRSRLGALRRASRRKGPGPSIQTVLPWSRLAVAHRPAPKTQRPLRRSRRMVPSFEDDGRPSLRLSRGRQVWAVEEVPN
jgi:hypothetical protein